MFILLILYLFFIILNSSLVINSIKESLLLFGFSIFPSLFIYIVISDLLIKYSHNHLNKRFFSWILKPFGLRYNSSIVILLSSPLIGNPATSKNIVDLLENNKIDKSEAANLLNITHFLSIGFILSFIGSTLYKDVYIGIIIWSSMLLSNIIMGLFSEKKVFFSTNIIIKKNNLNFPTELLKTLNNSINILLNIFAIVIFFGIISDLIMTLPLSYYLKISLASVIEATKGISIIENSFLPLNIQIVFITMLLSFGGVALNFQIINFISNKLDYKFFFYRRLLATSISGLIAFLFMHFYQKGTNTFAHYDLIYLYILGTILIISIFINEKGNKKLPS